MPSTSAARNWPSATPRSRPQLRRLHAHDGEPAKGKKRGRARNAPKFDLRTQLFQMCGVDLTRIDGIDVTTALVVVSEIGADMSRFPSDQALRLAGWACAPAPRSPAARS